MITMNDLKGSGAKFFGAGGPGSVSWNDLTDKPFGGEVKLLWGAENAQNGRPSRPMNIEDANGNFVFLGLKDGKTYQIEYDGTVYQCTAFPYTADGATVNVAIGNPELIPGYEHNGSPNSAPVVFMDSEDGATYCVEDGEEHSIKIFEEAIHTLDPKYLPEGVGGGGDLFIIKMQIDENWSGEGPAMVTVDKTIDEIYEAKQAGKAMYLFEGNFMLPVTSLDGTSLEAGGVINNKGQIRAVGTMLMYNPDDNVWMAFMTSEGTFFDLDFPRDGFTMTGEDNRWYRITVQAGGNIIATEIK